MKRSKLTQIPLEKLQVVRAVNFRDDYDVPAMVDEIVAAGGINEPCHVQAPDEGSDLYTALRGNRRITAAQLIRAGNFPQALKDKLAKIECFVYSDLTDRERTEIVLDHGSQKPLSRVETVKALLRLQRQMYTEREIITLMYQLLARFTGNTKKAFEAQGIPVGPSRDEYLFKWLHGTVGNYILSAGMMGEFVREQLLLTETANDRALTEEEQKQRVIKLDRGAVGKLASAKKEDKDSPAGWSTETGGPKFNALIEQLKEEYKNGKPKASGTFTKEQMEQTAESLQSDLRLAFLQCAGKLPEGDRNKVEALDTEIHRRNGVMSAIQTDIERVGEPKVKSLLVAILSGTGKDVTEALKSFVVTAQ